MVTDDLSVLMPMIERLAHLSDDLGFLPIVRKTGLTLFKPMSGSVVDKRVPGLA